MSSSKLASAVTLSSLALSGLSALPSFAQQLPRQPSTTVAPQQPVRSPVAINCPSGDHYKLTTGSIEGLCKVYVERGRVIGGFCTDGNNSALQSCSTGCKEITGSGGCEKLDPSAAGP
jgi:hypothetical protein